MKFRTPNDARSVARARSSFSPDVTIERNFRRKELCKLGDGQRTETARPKRVEALNFKLKLMRLKHRVKCRLTNA